MAEPVNLNRFRKAKRRADAQKQAAENRVAFGRTKAERDIERLKTEKATHALDQKRIDREDDC
ncbi:MAG: DUF4169 family protein [Alphaproteobacteria bacterium]|nr:DUF4169 family protein [Alphaproteobacteria bacterium]MDE1931811.1 DUF4169 family protein [Alphaproteobacteria bacterium]